MKVKKRIRTRVSCVRCSKCKDIIYSRARHDWHNCTCGNISIDGGFDYCHYGFTIKPPKRVIKYINATRSQLYQDWNYQKDKYGIIKGK